MCERSLELFRTIRYYGEQWNGKNNAPDDREVNVEGTKKLRSVAYGILLY
jgi:hypothetical protein